MKQLTSSGIVLARTDFGEADRIITMLTPDQGKLRLMARGVRRVKSKLAGGIELFSVSHITFIKGRGDISTLVSSRLQKHYGNIVKDLSRTMLGYDLIKILNRATEDETEEGYFNLMKAALGLLDSTAISLDLIEVWFSAQLLVLAGHTPNLQTDDRHQPLEPSQTYSFDLDHMIFRPDSKGRFSVNHIKLLRLLFSDAPPQALSRIESQELWLGELRTVVKTMLNTYIRI